MGFEEFVWGIGKFFATPFGAGILLITIFLLLAGMSIAIGFRIPKVKRYFDKWMGMYRYQALIIPESYNKPFWMRFKIEKTKYGYIFYRLWNQDITIFDKRFVVNDWVILRKKGEAEYYAYDVTKDSFYIPLEPDGSEQLLHIDNLPEKKELTVKARIYLLPAQFEKGLVGLYISNAKTVQEHFKDKSFDLTAILTAGGIVFLGLVTMLCAWLLLTNGLEAVKIAGQVANALPAESVNQSNIISQYAQQFVK